MQIACDCLNWLWQHLFEDLLLYAKATKQLKEKFNSIINSISRKELKEKQFNFPKPNGIIIDISQVIAELLNLNRDQTSDGETVNIPEYVKQAIKSSNREIFKYSHNEELETDIATIVNKSWFN